MFSLLNVLSWISEILSTNGQDNGQNETNAVESSTYLTDESKCHLTSSPTFGHGSTTNMVESTIEPAYYGQDLSFTNDLSLQCLRVSDSEDWDAEIDSVSSSAANMSEPKNNVGGSKVPWPSTTSAECSDKVNQSNLHEGLAFGSIRSNPQCQKEYFDNEVFPKASGQKRLEMQSTAGKSFSNKHSHYKHSHCVVSDDHTSSQHTDLNSTKSNPFHTRKQICMDKDIWNESSSDIPQTKSDENMFKLTNIPSERRFVTDILTNFHDSIPHDVSSEASKSNPGQTFDYENMFQWDYMDKLTSLEAIFTQEDKGKFLSTLKETLSCIPPYSFLLYLVENHYSNVIEGKKSLEHIALTQFEKWRGEGWFAELSGPTEMEKDRALWIVTTRKLYLFDLCNKVFKLDSKGNEYLQRHVYYLLQGKRRYKEAVTIACKLNLQPCFQPMEILFPLVILNKVQLAESYIANCPWQQRAFVSMLDKLCVLSDDQLDELTSEIIPAKPTSNKVTQASLTKLGERIVKKFNLNPDDFPELFKAKNVKGLSYLLHQRQKDRGGSSKKWDDLIERCVGNNTTLQQSLVDLLTEFEDQDEAKRWERFYQLSSRKDLELPKQTPIPSTVEDWEDEIRENEKVFSDYTGEKSDHRKSVLPEKPLEEEEQYHPRVKYLKLQIPMENIYFIDNTESLRLCQRALCKRGVIVGFDAEWKPQMCQAGLAQRLSIVQLSLRDRIFILDVIAVAEQVPDNAVLAFGNAFFANENVLKLGYGVESDFKALVTTLPILEKSIKKMKCFVDLCTLSQQLFEMPAMKKKVEKTTQSLKSFGHLSEKGLSLLVQQCLGLPLDKTYQLSDWEQRPLLTQQIEYAALDARCLIDVFEVLKNWMKDENIMVDLNESSPRLPWLFPKRSRRKQGKVIKQPKPGTSPVELERLNEPAVKGSPSSSRNFRVVVDNMLQGLGRYLRCCGVDVVMLANEDGHDRAAKIARREDRVILTTGTPYYTLRSQVPLGQCMCVPAGSTKEQVLAVFKHFNIQVNTSDIFSRCQICNGNEYIKVGSILMRQAYINYYESNHEGRGETSEHYSTNSPGNTTIVPPLDVKTLTLRSGVKLKIEALPEAMLDKIELFYCCATCGKIFWEGGHFSAMCTQFSDVLNNTGTVYQAEEKSDLK